MTKTIAQLDKTLSATVTEGHGTIVIRVVVLDKTMTAAAAVSDVDDTPLDAVPDELLPESDKQPTSSFLEEPKRGRQVCVFLINGQRQHAWDNQFIVRDLELKYLRNRMLVIVDCDGLLPEATAELMQGSRHQFLEGHVYSALTSRVVATLKGDPDLRRLEELAEDEIANLQAGDEVVKAALDQLIESHHDSASRVNHGTNESGDATRQDFVPGTLTQTQDIVKDADTGPHATEPVLQLRPDVATIRLKPMEARSVLIHMRPESAWKDITALGVTFDPPVKELQVVRKAQLAGDELTLTFSPAPDCDEDEYPIETAMRVSATVSGFQETRILERRVIITPTKTGPTPVPKPLLDDPTFIKVTSRQPVLLVLDGPDVHVKLKWDGKDELTAGDQPDWVFRATCESPSLDPPIFLTRPVEGRFELLIQVASGLKAGEQLKFDIEAAGQGKTLSTAFLATVTEPISPRKGQAKVHGGAQRRPPYVLKYINKPDWSNPNLNCFGRAWSGAEAGSFEPPSGNSPLVLFVNNDTDQLIEYRDALLARRLVEATVRQRISKYTTHVAFHLYQMYLKRKAATESGEEPPPTDSMLREEIQRVATTLIKVMDTSQ